MILRSASFALSFFLSIMSDVAFSYVYIYRLDMEKIAKFLRFFSFLLSGGGRRGMENGI